MTTLRDNPHVVLGINEEGSLQLYVTPFELNPVGPRLERGKALPHNYYKFLELKADKSTHEEAIDFMAIQALRDFHRYLHPKTKIKQ